MLEGLQILIDRMETNPDEFADGEWDYFLGDDLPYPDKLFTPEECEAIKEARAKLEVYKHERRRKRFTEQVIQHLFDRNNPIQPIKQESVKFSKHQAIMEIQRRKAEEAMRAYAKEYKREDIT